MSADVGKDVENEDVENCRKKKIIILSGFDWTIALLHNNIAKSCRLERRFFR